MTSSGRCRKAERFHYLERYLRRQYDVQQLAIQPQGFVFLVLLEEPAAVTELFVAELELIERLDINENLCKGCCKSRLGFPRY